MASEEREDFWQAASLFQRDDGECAAPASFPIDGKVLGVDLDDLVSYHAADRRHNLKLP